MLRRVLFLLFIPISCIGAVEPEASPAIEIQELTSLKLKPEERIPNLVQKISERALCLGASSAFCGLSLLTRLGGGICLITPWTERIGNEFLLLSRLLATLSEQAFINMWKGSSFSRKSPFSHNSWQRNHLLLSQIPTSNNEDKELLNFLKERWLAKSNGFISFAVDWICPLFGIPVQVHPMTSHAYARDPWNNLSKTYNKAVDVLKQSLPHPKNFPLILTRPFELQHYLPSYLAVDREEKIQSTVERCVKMKGSRVILDLTTLFSSNEEEYKAWETYRGQFSKACQDNNLDLNTVLCIQRVNQKKIGGIRILPLPEQSEKQIDLHHRFLLEWISCFGLTANRIELDRPPISEIPSKSASSLAISYQSKEQVLSFIELFEQNWNSEQVSKSLMVKGTLHTIKGLLMAVSDEKWQEILSSPTRSLVAQISFLNIQDQLKLLEQQSKDALFFNTASYLEEIHANLTALLEIFSPFSREDFPSLYQNLLTSIPANLKPLTSGSLHASAMTSLVGIFKAAEKTLGRVPFVLYGENTYFECIKAAKLLSHSVSINEATEDDWSKVDLILGHFNPVMRTDFHTAEYKVEQVEATLHKALAGRQNNPLVLALDCTLDYINSPRVAHLLEEFEKQIQEGKLIVISYRSGLKFDLFGMDNYCGAPFFIVHSKETKWTAFDDLLDDPVLQTDHLSLNWFCLAYQNAASELELYRRQIFDNTRTLLNKTPARLLNNIGAGYRIIPIEKGADAAFIDIKVTGPFHQARGAALVGGSILTTCMKNKDPVFNRLSLGFYHPNFFMIFDKEVTTLRLTVGLDPGLIDHLVQCFNEIDALNDSPWHTLWNKVQLPLPPQEAAAF